MGVEYTMIVRNHIYKEISTTHGTRPLVPTEAIESECFWLNSKSWNLAEDDIFLSFFQQLSSKNGK